MNEIFKKDFHFYTFRNNFDVFYVIKAGDQVAIAIDKLTDVFYETEGIGNYLKIISSYIELGYEVQRGDTQ